MAITQDGINVNMGFRALSQGEGIIVTMNTSISRGNDRETRDFQRKGQELDIFGKRLNAHENNFADAKTRLATEIDNFSAEVSQFITDWNNGDIEGSPNYTPPE